MPGQREAEFFLWNAGTVITDTNQLLPPGKNIDLYCQRACVQAVLNQFFYDRRWSFDNFASSDLINQVVG